MFESKEQLKEAINLYSKDKEKCIEKYGKPNDWNVSNITDMCYLFHHIPLYIFLYYHNII